MSITSNFKTALDLIIVAVKGRHAAVKGRHAAVTGYIIILTEELENNG